MLARLGLRARGRLDPGRAARPPRRAARGDRARGRRARALRHRDPPPPAHRGARGRGAVPRRARRAQSRCRTSATRSLRERHHRASPGCCAATRRPGSRTWRSGTSATSRTPRPSGWRCPTRRSCSTTSQHLAIRVVDGHARAPRPDARQPRAHPRRAVLASARCSRWSRAAWRATRPTGSSRRTPSAPGTPAPTSASCSATAAPGLDLDAVFDPQAFVRHAGSIVARLDALA